MTAIQIIAIAVSLWLAATMPVIHSPVVAHHDICIAQVFVDSTGHTDKRQICGDWTRDWKLVSLR